MCKSMMFNRLGQNSSRFVAFEAVAHKLRSQIRFRRISLKKSGVIVAITPVELNEATGKLAALNPNLT